VIKFTLQVEGLRAQSSPTQGARNWIDGQVKQLAMASGLFARYLVCQRKDHLATFVFLHSGSAVVKIGQYPSIEHIAGGEIERFKGILSSAEYAELHRAGGLYAHGVGIGSFVYLRRIFEGLIEGARSEIDPNDEHKEEFYRLRMSEKIDALRSVIPSAVVDYKESYGILSKGLHELSEDECRRYFPIVRAAIIAMLEERYDEVQKRKAAEELKRAVTDAAARLR